MKTFLYYLILACTFLSCKKDPYDDPDNLKLPPITMEGKNTFGCKVNGKVWIPYVDQIGLFNKPLEVHYDVGTIRITARIQTENKFRDEKISFQIFGDTIGKNTLNYPRANYTDFTSIKSTCSNFKISSIPGIVIVTKNDFNNRILAGEFKFINLINECADSISVEEGRFDVTY